ncbi:MAG: methyltransferase [Archaeoglobaceae archaeon]|nr:methyltransferase [Archaeoglobaceae archaeon]
MDFLEKERSIEDVANHFGYDLRITKALIFLLKYQGLIEGNEKFRISKICRILFGKDSKFSITELIQEKIEEAEKWLKFENMLFREVRNEANFFKKRIVTLGKFAILGDIKIVKRVAELEEFKNARRLLDLGGGHGFYSYAFTMLNENLKAYVFDLPEVVEVSRELMKNLDAERVDFIAGDFFKDSLGSSFDIVFSSFNPGGKRAELIPKIYNSLNPGGVYVNRQFFPENDFRVRDFEWNLWSFEKLEKDFKSFTFKGDLSLRDYIEELKKKKFKILKILKEDYSVIFAKKPNFLPKSL